MNQHCFKKIESKKSLHGSNIQVEIDNHLINITNISNARWSECNNGLCRSFVTFHAVNEDEMSFLSIFWTNWIFLEAYKRWYL